MNEEPDSQMATPEHQQRRMGSWVSGVTFGAIILIVVGAVITPLGSKFIDELWPNDAKQSRTAPTATADTSSPGTVDDPLVILPDWPTLRGCDGGTEVAMPMSAESAGDVVASTARDLREQLVDAGGASWGVGHLYLDFSVKSTSLVQVVDLKPKIYRRVSVAPKWIYTPQGACGDVYERVFALNLDEPSIADMGLQGEPAAQTGAAPPVDRLGPAFKISASDPALVRVDVTSCSGYYEWGIEVTYVVDGRERSRLIGTLTDPLRSWGMSGNVIPWFTLQGSGDPTRLRPFGTTTNAQGCI